MIDFLPSITIPSEGETLTKNNSMIQRQIVSKIKRFNNENSMVFKPSTIDNLPFVLSFLDEIMVNYRELENSNSHLQNIVQSQHSAICTMTKVNRSPTPSPSHK